MAVLDAPEIEVREGVDRETVETVANMGSYKYGWDTEIEMEYAPKGINEDIVRLISAKNDEPEWMTEWRLAAFRRWQGMTEPRWAMLNYPEIDYQDQYYYARPKSMAVKPKSLDEVDPALLATYAGRVAKWWTPDEVVVVDQLPHTATGKLNKLALRQQFRDYQLASAKA